MPSYTKSQQLNKTVQEKKKCIVMLCFINAIDGKYCKSHKNAILGKKTKRYQAPKKKSDYQIAEESTWKIMSRVVRLRDTDKNGLGRCIATGKQIWYYKENGRTISNCDGGHYHSRAIKSLILFGLLS